MQGSRVSRAHGGPVWQEGKAEQSSAERRRASSEGKNAPYASGLGTATHAKEAWGQIAWRPGASLRPAEQQRTMDSSAPVPHTSSVPSAPHTVVSLMHVLAVQAGCGAAQAAEPSTTAQAWPSGHASALLSAVQTVLSSTQLLAGQAGSSGAGDGLAVSGVASGDGEGLASVGITSVGGEGLTSSTGAGDGLTSSSGAGEGLTSCSGDGEGLTSCSGDGDGMASPSGDGDGLTSSAEGDGDGLASPPLPSVVGTEHAGMPSWIWHCSPANHMVGVATLCGVNSHGKVLICLARWNGLPTMAATVSPAEPKVSAHLSASSACCARHAGHMHSMPATAISQQSAHRDPPSPQATGACSKLHQVVLLMHVLGSQAGVSVPLSGEGDGAPVSVPVVSGSVVSGEGDGAPASLPGDTSVGAEQAGLPSWMLHTSPVGRHAKCRMGEEYQLELCKSIWCGGRAGSAEATCPLPAALPRLLAIRNNST